jgi:hypothetical protein
MTGHVIAQEPHFLQTSASILISNILDPPSNKFWCNARFLTLFPNNALILGQRFSVPKDVKPHKRQEHNCADRGKTA